MPLGSGIGLISPGQADYLQVTKGGGNGDYKLLVYAPSTVQESVDLIGLAFDKAEEYQTPVIFLPDGAIGQMMEGVELPPMQEINPDKPWQIDARRMTAKAGNTPFDGLPVQGRATAVWKGGLRVA